MHTVIRYILCYVDIIGSGDFFQSRLQCKRARAIFFSQFYVHINVKLHVLGENFENIEVYIEEIRDVRKQLKKKMFFVLMIIVKLT